MHTPGPWEVNPSPDGGFAIMKDVSPRVAFVHTSEADARLIAAAPALLEALEGLLSLDHIQRNKHLPGVERALAAVASVNTSVDQSSQNARLNAAAPAMLQALERIADDNGTDWRTLVAKAAIAQAKGEQP